MYFALLGIIFAGYALLSWRNLRTALLLLCGLLPTYLLRLSAGPIPTTALEILILIAFGVWVVKHDGWKIGCTRNFGRLKGPVFLMLIATSLAVSVAPDKLSALGLWKAYFIEPVIVFLMLKTTLTERADWLKTTAVLAISAAAIALVTIIQRTTGFGIPVPWDVELRATSLFDFPNAVGLYIAPAIAALSIFFIRTKQATHRIKLGFVLLLLLAGVVLAKTEAALVAIPAALLGTLLISSASRKTKITATVTTMVLGILLVILSGTVREKLFLHDLSGQVRRAQWSETLHVIADRPLLGTGLGGYPVALAPYHDNTLYEIFQYPHNILLNIWVELGLLGVIAFAWLAFAVLVITREKHNDTLVLAAFSALLTMTVHGLVDVPYFKNDLAVLTWIFLALLTVSPPNEQRSHST